MGSISDQGHIRVKKPWVTLYITRFIAQNLSAMPKQCIYVENIGKKYRVIKTSLCI